MIITPYQVGVPVIGLLLIAYAWSLVVRQKKTVWEGVLWTVFWVAVGAIAAVPSLGQFLSTITGIKRNETAVTVTAIGILFFIVFYLVIRIEALGQRLTSIVRDDALQDIEKHRAP
jgi:hypothetical protein